MRGEPGSIYLLAWWARQPVVLHGSCSAGEMLLLGIHLALRAQPQYTFRLLANGIHNGLD